MFLLDLDSVDGWMRVDHKKLAELIADPLIIISYYLPCHIWPFYHCKGNRARRFRPPANDCCPEGCEEPLRAGRRERRIRQ